MAGKYRIAICVDRPLPLRSVLTGVRKWCGEAPTLRECGVFPSVDAFMMSVDDPAGYDLAFVDAKDMPQGIQDALALRRENKAIRIVLLNAGYEQLRRLQEAAPWGFLDAVPERTAVEQLMELFTRTYSGGHICFRFRKTEYTVAAVAVMYVSAYHGRTEIGCEDGEVYVTCQKAAEIQEKLQELGEQMLRIGYGDYINLRHVLSYGKGKVVLRDRSERAVGQKYREEILRGGIKRT